MIRNLLINSAVADRSAKVWSIGRLVGASAPLAAAELARSIKRPMLVLARDPRHADQLESEIRYFAGDDVPIVHFVEWETLPYDSFSPHQDIISRRLRVIATCPQMKDGIVIVSTPALLQRLPPVDYVGARTLLLKSGQTLDRQDFIDALAAAAYLRIPQVEEHGEFAVRGSLIDVFPMGSDQPVRIDFFDDEIETLRHFDPETQLSGETAETIQILPAREIPLDQESIKQFRQRYRERFEGQPSRSRVYSDVSDGIAHGGIEYYLPLFFEETASILDYLPDNTVVFAPQDVSDILEQTWLEIGERYELCSLDPERPILEPEESFLNPDAVLQQISLAECIQYSAQTLEDSAANINLSTRIPPALCIETRYEDATASLINFLDTFDGRILFTADSPGRRERVYDLLAGRGIDVSRVDSWDAFLAGDVQAGYVGASIRPAGEPRFPAPGLSGARRPRP